MSASVREALRGKPLPDSAITIRYGEQAIGAVPVRIELTPQDWLRFAKIPANEKWQAQALEKALGMNPEDTALRKTLAEQYLAERGTWQIALPHAQPTDRPLRQKRKSGPTPGSAPDRSAPPIGRLSPNSLATTVLAADVGACGGA